ncbi:MAG: pilus assembly protein [Candidatus Paracaedimonas acanthamoebae]|uniref:Pilus assembly protein n=1 Tax=Candidatus Paracaedimonas acanthamoebae TaxID=244581 RepID=A0A8J7Q026_9PROT|nr:pilus assembly protein [Candidatus Paracaedimonas acanthamoebae]
MRKNLNKSGKIFFHRMSDEKGASVVEFSLLAPLFIFFIFAVIQMGAVLTIDNALEASIREGARYGITAQGGSSRDSQIRNVIQTIAKNYSGGLINPSNLIITINSYPTFQALDANTSASNGAGTGNQAVKYQVQYTWDTIFPIFGSSNLIVLKAQTPVMNEGFEN